MRLSEIEALAKKGVDSEPPGYLIGDVSEALLKVVALARSFSAALRATKRGRELSLDKQRKFGIVVD